MEDTLGEIRSESESVRGGHVLILVLMEDTLGVTLTKSTKTGVQVLILVLMEDTLGGSTPSSTAQHSPSLNPCFNGRYSRRQFTIPTGEDFVS